MINLADEIVDLLNFIRPKNDQVQRDKIFTGEKNYLTAYPAFPKNVSDEYCKPKYGVAGGTFIFTSDSRFPSVYPIPLHDRQEYENKP